MFNNLYSTYKLVCCSFRMEWKLQNFKNCSPVNPLLRIPRCSMGDPLQNGSRHIDWVKRVVSKWHQKRAGIIVCFRDRIKQKCDPLQYLYQPFRPVSKGSRQVTSEKGWKEEITQRPPSSQILLKINCNCQIMLFNFRCFFVNR